MASQVLARKWRPHNFESVVGQEPVVQALTHALTENRLHHAYLFTGTRGVGKTTLSRILAKSLNCQGPDGKGGVTATPCGVCEACRAIDEGRFVDYIEMDAASNRSVEEMTALLEQAMYAPTNARYKVYMIDEVHQLTTHAFNAMLKTLEEPPEYVKFILATTDPQKVPVTVLSRCIQFNLKNVTPQLVAEHMSHILEAEKIQAEPAALKLLGLGARGSMRDGLSLLDQAIAFAGDKPVTLESVREMLGMMDSDVLISILEGLAQGNARQMMAVADQMSSRSLSFSQAIRDLAGILHRIALAQFDPASIAPDDLDRESIFKLAQVFSPKEVQLYYQIALNARGDMNLAPDEYAGFTMALMRMLAFKPAGFGSVSLPKRFDFSETKSSEASAVATTAVTVSLKPELQTQPQADVSPVVESQVLAKLEPQSNSSEPAPWEDIPEVARGASLATEKKLENDAVGPEVKTAATKVASVATELAPILLDDEDDDAQYVDDGYGAAMQQTIDEYDLGFDMPTIASAQEATQDEEPFREEQKVESYEATSSDVPPFSDIGRVWYEKMKFTYPASHARDVLFKSECVAIEPRRIELHLDPFYAGRLQNPVTLLNMQKVVDPVFGHRMQIDVKLVAPQTRTIDQHQRLLAKEAKTAEDAQWLKSHYVTIDDESERKAAAAAINATPQAKMIARRFNARIDNSSVKKLSSRSRN